MSEMNLYGNSNQYKVRLRFYIFHLLSYDQFFLFPRTLQFSRVFTIVPVKKNLPMVNRLTGGQANSKNYQAYLEPSQLNIALFQSVDSISQNDGV